MFSSDFQRLRYDFFAFTFMSLRVRVNPNPRIIIAVFFFNKISIQIFTVNSPKGALVPISDTKELYVLRTRVFVSYFTAVC